MTRTQKENKKMKNFKELEEALLDQIEKLNDDSIGEDPDACQG